MPFSHFNPSALFELDIANAFIDAAKYIRNSDIRALLIAAKQCRQNRPTRKSNLSALWSYRDGRGETRHGHLPIQKRRVFGRDRSNIIS